MSEKTTKYVRTPSYASKIYGALRQGSFTAEELYKKFQPEDDGNYIRVLLTRWLDKGAIQYGPWRDNRRTYTARGCNVELKFRPAYGQQAQMVLALLKRKPHTIRQLMHTLPFSESGIRTTITRLRDQKKIKAEERDRTLVYSSK